MGLDEQLDELLMLVCEAARKTMKVIPPAFVMKQDPKGTSIGHAKWMLNEIRTLRIQGEKAHRWLGWAQAILALGHYATLDEMKEINKNA